MQCLAPFPVSLPPGRISPEGFSFVVVPCGKCPNCRTNRVQGWVFRLMQQYKDCNSAEFVTLTYSPEFLPTTLDTGRPTLSKVDMQQFFFRLRSNIKRSTGKRRKIKYYCVGEYGGRYWRPHYHLIIFNVSRQEIHNAWSLNGVPIGRIDYGDRKADLFTPERSNVNSNTIGYCCKYICKPSRIGKDDDRLREFSHMSKGLGLNYLTPEVLRYHQEGQRAFVMDGQYPQAMPRYYKNKIFSDSEREELYMKAQSGKAENLIRGFIECGYVVTLPKHHKINREAVKRYYHNVYEGVKAAFRNSDARNKRDKVW